MAGVGKLLKQAQKMQRQMEQMQAELAEETIEVSSGGGAVKIKISLQQELKSIEIDPELLKEEKDVVEETLLEAVREAYTSSKNQSEERMSGLTSGMQIPGLL